MSSRLETVIVTYNSAAHICPCLQSMQDAGVSAVVVDNDSRDDTLTIVRKEFPEVRVIAANGNLGYGSAANLGVAATDSEIVLVANADTVFPEDSLATLAGFVSNHPRVGVAGPQQLFPNGSWQRSYGDVHGVAEAIKVLVGITSLEQVLSRRFALRRRTPPAHRVGFVDGAVMMLRRSAFDEIGGFDPQFHHYCEDVDLCLRFSRAGWDVVTVPTARAVHVRGGSSTQIEGHSENLLRTHANAYRKLICKYHSETYFSLYRMLRALHAWKMLMIYRCLRAFDSGSNVTQTTARVLTFERWTRILAEFKS